MTDKARDFLRNADGELKKKLDALTGEKDQKKLVGKVVALAKEEGIALTAEDFAGPEGEMSDEELAAVAGGGWNCGGMWVTAMRDKGSEDCFKVGSDEGGKTNPCTCIAAGALR